jgi:hypothetical protein
MNTSPKGSSFAFADQGTFVSAIDVGCRVTNSAATNTALIISALTAMTTGGVLLIPHGIDHTFTSGDFPVTGEELCVWEFTGNTFKLTNNQTSTTSLTEILESLRIVLPKVVGIDFVDVLTDPPTYTFKQQVYNNSGSPVIAGSSFDLCYFLPGGSTPTEAIARSGTTPGLHYFYNGINVAGTVTLPTLAALNVTALTNRGIVAGSKSIQAPLTGTSIAMADGVEHLILNHSATIAALTVTLPPTPVDGQLAKVFSRSIVTALTLNAGAGETIETGHGLTTLAAAGSFEMIFNSSDSKWYRVR